MNTTAPDIRLTDVTVSYARHPAVHHVSGRFAPGSMTAIVGPNGAGKSTLLRAVAGLAEADGKARLEGRIDRGGLDPRAVAYLPQQAALDRQFPIACRDLVATGLWPLLGAFAAVPGDARDRADTALQAVGLAGFARRPVASLSAGQFQRALFARMLLQDAPVLLLDEPFTALDARTTADLLALLVRWHGEARTIIAVLHDLDMVRETFPSCLLLARDAIAWGPTEEVLRPENRLRARRMAEAWEERTGVCERAA
jgi:zinc/manganese transport system ATP-binding protein